MANNMNIEGKDRFDGTVMLWLVRNDGTRLGAKRVQMPEVTEEEIQTAVENGLMVPDNNATWKELLTTVQDKRDYAQFMRDISAQVGCDKAATSESIPENLEAAAANGWRIA